MGKDRWKAFVALVFLFGISIVVYGPWPVWYAKSIVNFVGDKHAKLWSASLGLWALPLYIPALFVPLDREKRLIALTATTYLVSPYLPYYSTIFILIFNIPVFAYLFAFVGYLTPYWRQAWNSVVLLPVFLLAWLYFPYVKIRYQKILNKG